MSSSSYRIVSFTLLAMDLMTLISPLLSQVYVESRRLKDLVKGPTVSSQEPRQAQYTCGSRRLLVSFAAPRLHGSIKLSLFSQLLWHRLPFWPFPRLSHYRVKMSSCVELQRDDSSRSPPNSQMAAPGASRSTTSSSRLATTKTKKVSKCQSPEPKLEACEPDRGLTDRSASFLSFPIEYLTRSSSVSGTP